MLKWGAVIWICLALYFFMGLAYPEQEVPSLEMSIRMFIIANIWAVGYFIERRIVEMTEECKLDNADKTENKKV